MGIVLTSILKLRTAITKEENMEFVSAITGEKILITVIFLYALCGFALATWGSIRNRVIFFTLACASEIVGIACIFYPPLLTVVYTGVLIYWIAPFLLSIFCLAVVNTKGAIPKVWGRLLHPR